MEINHQEALRTVKMLYGPAGNIWPWGAEWHIGVRIPQDRLGNTYTYVTQQHAETLEKAIALELKDRATREVAK